MTQNSKNKNVIFAPQKLGSQDHVAKVWAVGFAVSPFDRQEGSRIKLVEDRWNTKLMNHHKIIWKGIAEQINVIIVQQRVRNSVMLWTIELT